MLLGKSTLKLLVLNDWHKTTFLSLTATEHDKQKTHTKNNGDISGILIHTTR